MKFPLLSFLFITLLGNAQTNKFNQLVEGIIDQRDSIILIKKASASTVNFNPLSYEKTGYEKLEILLLNWFSDESKNRQFDLSRSLLLDQLARIGNLTTSNSYYNGKRLSIPSRNINRVILRSSYTYRITDCYAFSIPLVKNPVRKFYYDRKGNPDELNLFLRPKKSEKGEIDLEPIPLELYSEAEILKLLIKESKKKGINKKLKTGVYYVSGISIVPDKNSFHKKKIPRARIFVILGAKRMHKLKK